MERYTYPHTIENGAGESLTFLRRMPGTNGDRLEVENVVSPGSGPPMHVHHYQEEALTVIQGRIGYQRPGEPAVVFRLPPSQRRPLSRTRAGRGGLGL